MEKYILHAVEADTGGKISKKRKTAKQKGQVYIQQVPVMALEEGRCLYKKKKKYNKYSKD